MNGLRLHLFNTQDFTRFYKVALALVVSGSVFDWASTLFLGNPAREANPVIVSYALLPGSSWLIGVSIWGMINVTIYSLLALGMYRLGRGSSKPKRAFGMLGLYLILSVGALGHFLGGATWIIHLAGGL